MRRAKNFARGALVPLLVLALWQAVASLGLCNEFILPSPLRVARTFIAMCASGELTRGAAVSLGRVTAGFLLSFVLAFTAASALSLRPGARPYLKPLFDFIRHIPPMSLIPLLILWTGIGEAPKLIIILLTSFFPIYMDTLGGLLDCPTELLEVGRSFGFGLWRRFTRIMLPYALPRMLLGMRVGLGYSFRAIVGAEMIAAASGLGYLILDAQALSRSDKVMAGILVLAIVGVLTDRLFDLVIRRVEKSRGTAGGNRA